MDARPKATVSARDGHQEFKKKEKNMTGIVPLTFHPHDSVSSHSRTMSYPKQILFMKQSLLRDPSLDEDGFHMLWNTILNYQFPVELGYGVARPVPIPDDDAMPELLVVRITDESKHVVVVARLSKSDDKAPDARNNMTQELVGFIERFAKTKYPTVYGIASMGFSWTALKMDRTDPDQPTTLVPWNDDVMSDESFLALKAVADEIHAMAHQL